MGMSAAHCQRIVREMSGNFIVSGEWSPCIVAVDIVVYILNHHIAFCAQLDIGKGIQPVKTLCFFSFNKLLLCTCPNTE